MPLAATLIEFCATHDTDPEATDCSDRELAPTPMLYMTAFHVDVILTLALNVAAVVANVVDPVVIDTGKRMNEHDIGSGRKNPATKDCDAPLKLAVVASCNGAGMF